MAHFDGMLDNGLVVCQAYIWSAGQRRILTFAGQIYQTCRTHVEADFRIGTEVLPLLSRVADHGTRTDTVEKYGHQDVNMRLVVLKLHSLMDIG